EHLREVWVVAFDVLAEVVTVLEVERLLARALGRHRELQAPLARLGRHARAELLVHQHAGHGGGGRGARRGPRSPAEQRRGADGDEHALEDQVLGVRDDRGLLGVRLALDPKELLLEGTPVVEREDVELAGVAALHRMSIAKGVGLGREVLRMGRRCLQAQICSWFAGSADRRSAPTSPSARTAVTGCGGGPRSSRASAPPAALRGSPAGFAGGARADPRRRWPRRGGAPRAGTIAGSAPRRTPRSPWSCLAAARGSRGAGGSSPTGN